MSDYPDFFRGTHPGDLVIDSWQAQVVGADALTPAFYVAPYGALSVLGTVTAEGAGCFPLITIEWSDDPTVFNVLASQAIGPDLASPTFAVTVPTVLPYVRFRFGRGGANTWTTSGQVIAHGDDTRGRRFVGPNYGVLVSSSGALGAGLSANLNPAIVTAGEAHAHGTATAPGVVFQTFVRLPGGAFTLIAKGNSGAGPNNYAERIVIPAGLIQFSITNTTAGALNYDASLVLAP